MAKYKPDQGTYARTSSFLLLGAMVAFGCHTMYYFLLSFRGTEDAPGFLVRDLLGGKLPVLGIPLTPALIIALVVCAGLLYWLKQLLEKPKAADLLIESETEMRKCTWPTWDETFNVSIVILVVMLFFTGMLAGMDYVLSHIMMNFIF